MSVLSLNQFKEMMRELSRDHSLEQYRDAHRLAAVLILVYQGADELEIILTKRSGNLSNHAGQISFPGGTVDETDTDLVFTALREAYEEIALPGKDVEVLGILNTTLLPSGFAVAPVLGLIEYVPALTANPAEVDEIFSIPLSLAGDLSRYGEDFLIKDGVQRDFYYLHYQHHYIWGATAKILRSLGELLEPGSASET